ncbi:hypothetical protein KY309_02970 [Candidatus Woesearchaeota archaeon]|nr:hypothetical protein [Candidatus Woesearchaeota archaeon]MBW3016548.1 hypothetical protein [Candidatus Woesearchaeota archaeon]
MPKVLIGVVTHGKQRFCLDEFQESLDKQSVKSDVLFVVNHGESAYVSLLRSRNLNAVENPVSASSKIEHIVSGRKYLREYALKNGYDELIFVDSDVMLPAGGVEWLLATNGDVVSGVCLEAFMIDGKTVVAPFLFKDIGGGQCKQFTYDGIYRPQVVAIGAAGFGCVRIKRKVLEAVDIRANTSGREDISFFVDAREKGFKCFANTLVKCVHRVYPKEDARSGFFEWKRRIEDFNFDVKL